MTSILANLPWATTWELMQIPIWFFAQIVLVALYASALWTLYWILRTIFGKKTRKINK